MKTRKSNQQRAENKKSMKPEKASPRAASSRAATGERRRSSASSKRTKQPPGRSRDLERTRKGDKKLRNKPTTRPGKAPRPNPADLERPAPNEPVRIQPPTPRFAGSERASARGRRNETAAPRNEEAAHAADEPTDAAEREASSEPNETSAVEDADETEELRHDIATGTRGPSSRDDETSPPNVDAASRRAEMIRERGRLRSDPERQRGVDRRGLDANRWVHQRANQPRGGRWQAHGHASFRGR
jgi:hypothetical protein